MKNLKASKKSVQASKFEKLSLKQSRKIVGGSYIDDRCYECKG